MYFLDDKSLARDLARRAVPQSDVAIYVFLLMGGQIPVWYPAPFPEKAGFTPDPVAFLSGLAAIAIGVYGVRAAWRANGGNDGENFAERFVALGWVSGFQIALVAAPVFLSFALYAPEIARAWTPAFWVIVTLVYFWRVWKLMKDTKQIEDARRITSS